MSTNPNYRFLNWLYDALRLCLREWPYQFYTFLSISFIIGMHRIVEMGMAIWFNYTHSAMLTTISSPIQILFIWQPLHVT